MANYTILLIDYDPRSIERTRTLLEGAGYRVEIAKDGEAGLKAFESLHPDLVVTEAMIPKRHGFEVCQEIKNSPSGKQTPVVITTAVYKGRKYRTQALHLYGCDEYVEKPVDDEKMVTICRELLKDLTPNEAPAGKEEIVEEVAAEKAAAEPAPRPSKRKKDTRAKAKKKAERQETAPDQTEDEIVACLDAIMPDDSSDEDDTAVNLDPMSTTAANRADF